MPARAGFAGWLLLWLVTAALSAGGLSQSTSVGRATTNVAFAPACGGEIANLDVIDAVPMILLGELHGLEAVPRFAVSLACRLASAGKPVLLALEIPRQEQDRIDTFLASNGGSANDMAVLDGAFWRREFQDGRSSRSRLEMLEAVRVLRAGGLPVRVVAVDDATVPGPARDEAMASGLLAARKPGEIALLLVGDLHARTKPGAPWNPNIVWAGVHLQAREPKLVSLVNRFVTGEAWLCLSGAPSECGVKTVRGSGTSSGFRIERFAARDSIGFDGTFEVGRATASPPAVVR